MKSEVLVGPAASLEDELATQIEVARAENALAPIHVVVPSNILAVALRRRLALRLGGVFNLRLMTFVELVKLLAGPAKKPLAGDLERLAAVRAAVVDSPGYFAEVAEQSGLHRALLSTLRDMENAGVEGGELEALADRRQAAGDEAGAGDARRLRAIAAVEVDASRRLRGLFEIPSELFARSLKSERAGQLVGPCALLVYGFHDFTELQMRVLGCLTRTLPVRIFVADEICGESPYTTRTLTGLLGHGFESRALAAGAAPAQRLASALFDSSERAAESKTKTKNEKRITNAVDSATRPPDLAGSVDFSSAPGQRSEVRAAVRCLVGLLETGVSPDQIAITYRNSDPYPQLLSETLQRAGVKFFLAGGLKASETRYGKSMLLLLNLVGSDLQRADIIEFATFAPLSDRVLAGGSPGGWDWITRQAAVIKGVEQWRTRLKAFALESAQKAARREEPSRAPTTLVSEAEHLLTFANTLSADLDLLATSTSWASQSALLKDLLARYFEPAEGDVACLEAIARLARLEVIAPDQAFAVFREALTLQLESVAIQQGRVGRGHVFLGQPRDLRGLRFEHVFVLGLAERSFPPPVRSDSLLLDRERRAISAALPRTVLALDEERLLFSLLVGSSGHLHVSYPRQDENKPRPRFASPFLLALAEAAYGRPFDWRLKKLPLHEVPQLQPDRELPPEQALWAEEYDLTVVASINSDRPLTLSYLDAVSDHFASMRAASSARNVVRRLTSYDGYLRDPAGRQKVEAVLRQRLLSASALQQYAECPQRFLMSQLLRVEPLDEPESIIELSPLDRGEIIHSILERFYRTLKHRGELPLVAGDRKIYEDYVRLVEEVAADEFARAEERGVTGLLVAWKAHRRVLREDIVAFIDKELERASADLVPSEFEYSFGYPNDDSAPLELRLADDLTLRLRGKVDRIDLGARRARVIDYKSGKHKASKHRDGDDVSFAGGRQLQLPIYLLATAQAFGLEIHQVDASYFHINRDVRKPLNLSGASLEQRRADFDEIISLISGSMREGLFTPRTSQSPASRGRENCTYCDYRFVCPARVAINEERKAGDAAMATLHRLREIE